jgi:hypothetical protein
MAKNKLIQSQKQDINQIWTYCWNKLITTYDFKGQN